MYAYFGERDLKILVVIYIYLSICFIRRWLDTIILFNSTLHYKLYKQNNNNNDKWYKN